MKIILRKEEINDHRKVEELVREAFWNIYFPGCDAHYLVHKIRSNNDYIPELNYIAMIENEIVGNIIYTKSYVIDQNNKIIPTITFGPISVHPNFQRKGVGSLLINKTIEIAQDNNYNAIIIYGNPSNYSKFGFIGSKKYLIKNPQGKYPCSLLVKELVNGVFQNNDYKFYESEVFDLKPEEVDEYDKQFPKKEKGYLYKQEEFNILSRAFVE